MSILDDITQRIEKLPGIQGFILYWKAKVVQMKLPESIQKQNVAEIVEAINNVYTILHDNEYQIDDLFIGNESANTIVQPFRQGKLIFFASEKINFKMFTMAAKPIFKRLESTDTLAIYNQEKEKAEKKPVQKEIEYVPENILDSIRQKMAQAIGPMAKVLFNKHRKFPENLFPRSELRAFIQTLADYIPDEQRREIFAKEIL